MEKMSQFRDYYLSTRKNESLTIYDLGSQDVNGSYRPLFTESTWRYAGLDMSSGNNVDRVLKTPYVWKEIPSNSADVVISGQAFEHIKFMWITILEIARVLKPGGLCCIIAPSSGPEHRYPLDCWRFYPDGMSSLAQFAQLDVMQVSTQWEDKGYVDGSDWWHDTMMVCRKPDHGFFWNTRSATKRWLQHKALTIGLG